MLPRFVAELVAREIVERIEIPTFYLRQSDAEDSANVRGRGHEILFAGINTGMTSTGEAEVVGDRLLDQWIRTCLAHDECRADPAMGTICPWAEPKPPPAPDGVVGGGDRVVFSIDVPNTWAETNAHHARTMHYPRELEPAHEAHVNDGIRRPGQVRVISSPEAPPDRFYAIAEGGVEVGRITPTRALGSVGAPDPPACDCDDGWIATPDGRVPCGASVHWRP